MTDCQSVDRDMSPINVFAANSLPDCEKVFVLSVADYNCVFWTFDIQDPHGNGISTFLSYSLIILLLDYIFRSVRLKCRHFSSDCLAEAQ